MKTLVCACACVCGKPQSDLMPLLHVFTNVPRFPCVFDVISDKVIGVLFNLQQKLSARRALRDVGLLRWQKQGDEG